MQLTLNRMAAGLVGVAMVAGLAFAFAAERAHASQLSELVELFIALGIVSDDKVDEAREAVSAMEEATPSTPSLATSMSCSFTRNLSSGSTGQDVMDLQKLLNAKGFIVSASGAGAPGQETSYYGPATAAAVAAMQTAFASEILAPLGLSTGTGYFGASTRAKANALCAVSVPPTMPEVPTLPEDDMDDEDMDDEEDDSNDLGNGEGSIEAVNSSSADESTLEEGTEGGVLGFEVEIEGDVMINRVDAYAEVLDSATASDNADDYFVRAFLMVDGEEVAEIDVDDFDTDSYTKVTNGATADEEYRLRFSGLDLVYADGDEPEFQIGFEMLNSIDSDDIAGDWTVMVDSIRYEDGEGFMDTETVTGIDETFGFDAEEVAELKITESSSNPDASTIEVDDNDQTDDVAVFVFDIEERNGIDVTVEDLTVTATTTTGTVGTVIATAALYDGSTELDSVSVPDDGVIVFENLGLEIAGDDEVTLTVKLTFEETDAGYDDGEEVSVSFTSIDDAEDANGNDEGDMTITGTPSGETHTLYEAGLVVEVTEASTVVSAEDGATNDSVTFTWELEVTAFGDEDVYVTADFANIVDALAGASSTEIAYEIELSTGIALTDVSGTISSAADEVDGAGTAYTGDTFFRIESGTTETLDIVVTATNAADSKQVQAYLTAIEWTTDDVVTGVADGAEVINSYTSELATESETGFKSIN